MEKESTKEELLSELEELRPRLAEAEEIISKIQKGEVDALVVSREGAPELYMIRGAERPYRILVESMNEGAIRLTTEGMIVYANKSFVEMSGMASRGELATTYFEDLVADEDADRFSRLWENILKENFIADLQLFIAGRAIPIHMSCSANRLDEEPVVFAVLTDMSERKQAEDEREGLLEQLSQSQKMDVVGRLAGGIAHDFNNALQTILGYTSLAMMEVPEGSSLRRNLEAVQQAGEHSADLTRQLLAFAHKQAVEPLLVNLNVIISDILSMLKRLVGEDVNILWHPEADAATVKMDPAQINQILANLCVNAREAIEDVGNITIETHNIHFDTEYVKGHAGFEVGDFVLLEVSDDGSGMDKEVLEHLFEPFYTTRSVGKGTGLGLSTVYGIVKQNNGFINVYSEPDEGTTFRIYLRLIAGKPSARHETSTRATPRGYGETILLVEDDPAVLKLSQEIFERLGYQVIGASSPLDAIDKAKKYISEITLLVTDIIMPQMNGHDLAQRLQELKPELKCLYMSGYTAGVISHRGVLDEGSNFIQKPFSIEDLAVKVRQMLDTE